MYTSLEQRKSRVKVSVLCPGVVRTNIVNVERNRPAELRNESIPMSPEMQAGSAEFKAVMDAAMPPSQVAEVVFNAIRQEQFYILSHPEWIEVIQLRTESLLRMENPRNPTPAIMKLIKRKE